MDVRRLIPCQGAFIYEFGDHGGLIVMADDLKKTGEAVQTNDQRGSLPNSMLVPGSFTGRSTRVFCVDQASNTEVGPHAIEGINIQLLDSSIGATHR